MCGYSFKLGPCEWVDGSCKFLQMSDQALFTFYLPLANIDVPEYYLLLVAGTSATNVVRFWVDVAVLRSRNSRHHLWAPELSAVVLQARRFGAFVVGANLARPR
jgi:hypothetical protein